MSTREVINIQVGGCGNSLSNELLYRILNEHWLDNDGIFRNENQLPPFSQIETRLNKINTYFREINTQLFDGYIRFTIEHRHSTFIPTDIKNIMKYYLLDGSHNRFFPRNILVDLEPSSLDEIKMSNIGSLFHESHFHSSTCGAGHNYAKGFYTEGAEIIDEIMDTIRREAEDCNSLQAFQLIHSLGGGTGSGLASLILLKLKDNYPSCLNVTFSVVTRTTYAPEVNVESYNQTLSIHQLLEHSDITCLFDNDSLRHISYNQLRLREIKYCDLNWIASMAMSGITSTLRLGCKYNNNLHESWRKLGMNMISFPRLHFLLSSPAPIIPRGCKKEIKLTLQQVIDQIWSARNFMCNVGSDKGKFLSIASIFRSVCDIDEQDVNDEYSKIVKKEWDAFVSWIPNNAKFSIIDVPFANINNVETSGMLLANTTALKGIFQLISARFAKNFKRKAFLHWYKGEGMDEMEFQEADKNVRDLSTEYQDKQDAVVDSEDSDDDDYSYEEDEDEDF